MKSTYKTIQGLAEEYLVEWQTKRDYLRKIDRNKKKLMKYACEAHWRVGADDYVDKILLVLKILKHINNLKSKLGMHEESIALIRSKIIKLNPYKIS